jgi:hypothetical protein
VVEADNVCTGSRYWWFLFYAVGAYTLGEFELASSLEEFRRRTTWVVVPAIALLVGIAVFFGYEIYKMISK